MSRANAAKARELGDDSLLEEYVCAQLPPRGFEGSLYDSAPDLLTQVCQRFEPVLVRSKPGREDGWPSRVSA